MIIKGLFRRYERWNPVHPTYGAFWGMGVGIGCGVGWGPGFGPEVIGYVGAGCGVGFSVGITFAGFGIGLPVNTLMDAPSKVLMATSSTWDFVQSSKLKDLDLLKKGTEIFDVKTAISSQAKSISENFKLLKKDVSESCKDIRDRFL
ncbi:hypothetical protein BVRB_5g107660 [Beta vulgaris subsp. vulgaris]|nr:hypothetical protein BVRB_5g107660 [Beta vulgaris subsp. vulgaris]